jgi:multiple sugar transport system ATP-binding protein
VFQSYALYPHMSVRQNLAFGLENSRTPRAEIAERILAAARMLEIEPYLDRRPGQLSGGQRQRVAIGRAIVRRPVAFLLDEPLSNLDAELRVSTRAEIAALHARLKSTMIYVTHDQTEAMTLADRIVVLRAGRVEQVGTPLELYNAPENLFVAGFIGSPRMSFLEASVGSVGDGRATLRVEGEAMVEIACGDRPVAVGDSLTIGVRPQQMLVGDGPGSVAAKVTLVEQLGAETIVHALAGDRSLLAVLPGQRRLQPGEMVRFAIADAPLHVFDAAGLRVNPAVAAE